MNEEVFISNFRTIETTGQMPDGVNSYSRVLAGSEQEAAQYALRFPERQIYWITQFRHPDGSISPAAIWCRPVRRVTDRLVANWATTQRRAW